MLTLFSKFFKRQAPGVSIFEDAQVDVEYAVNISFQTNCQVRFEDEEGIPHIVEFSGTDWTWSGIIAEKKISSIRAFVNNYLLLKGQTLTLTRRVNDIIQQKKFELIGDEPYEGWFFL